jgi:hypothetical protein
MTKNCVNIEIGFLAGVREGFLEEMMVELTL